MLTNYGEIRMIDMLRAEPDLVEKLAKIITYETEHIDPNWANIYRVPGLDCAWEWHDVSIAPATLRRMVAADILRVVFKSNKTTAFSLVSRKAAEEALTEYRETEKAIVDPVIGGRKITPSSDLFATIVGFEDLKKTISLVLSAPKPVHILMSGPPASAKSSFLDELALLPDSLYILGSSASKVGLADELFSRLPRILLIDEIDKMDRSDYAVLLSLCQKGFIQETKHHNKRSKSLDTIVFAACNRTSHMPREVLSRFLKIPIPEYTIEQLADISYKTLILREGLTPELSESIVCSGIAYGLSDVRDFVRIGRLCSTKEQVEEVLKTMQKYDKQGA
jgi:Holliday junction DNA helicase RuvB